MLKGQVGSSILWGASINISADVSVAICGSLLDRHSTNTSVGYVPSAEANVRQLAPWAIRPRQFRPPILRQLAPTMKTPVLRWTNILLCS